MRVFRRIKQRNLKRGNLNATVWHSNFGFKGSSAYTRLAKVDPADVLVSYRTTSERSFWNSFREYERSWCDVEVFFFLSIDPFNDSINDQISEGNVTCFKIVQMAVLQTWGSVIEDEKWSQNSTLVCVDEDISVFCIVTNANFRRNGSTTSAVLELRKEVLSVLVHTVNVTVDVNSVTISPILWLIDVEFVETLANFLWIDFFRDIDHLSCVLYQTTVLPFRRLVWTETAPLSRVKVTGFEVRLASNQRRRNTTHVGKRSQIGGSVEQLADTGSPTDPVTSCKSVQNLG